MGKRRQLLVGSNDDPCGPPLMREGRILRVAIIRVSFTT